MWRKAAGVSCLLKVGVFPCGWQSSHCGLCLRCTLQHTAKVSMPGLASSLTLACPRRQERLFQKHLSWVWPPVPVEPPYASSPLPGRNRASPKTRALQSFLGVARESYVLWRWKPSTQQWGFSILTAVSYHVNGLLSFIMIQFKTIRKIPSLLHHNLTLLPFFS